MSLNLTRIQDTNALPREMLRAKMQPDDLLLFLISGVMNSVSEV